MSPLPAHAEPLPPNETPMPTTAASPERLTLRDTFVLIRSDLRRLEHHLGHGSLGHRIYYALLPGFQALLWHRLSRWLLLAGWPALARLLSLWSMYQTRAEIPPTSSIGESALIAHATGVYLFGRVGARLTIQGDGGFGGGFGTDDIGGGPGYPVAGDDVVLAFGARVLGPVRVGSRVHVGPGALVTFDLPDGALVTWARPRVVLGGAVPSPETRPDRDAQR